MTPLTRKSVWKLRRTPPFDQIELMCVLVSVIGIMFGLREHR